MDNRQSCNGCGAFHDPSEHDCGFPDCVGGWENAYGDAVAERDKLKAMLDFMIEREARIVRNLDGTCCLSFVLDGVHRHSTPNVQNGYEAIQLAMRME